MAECVRKPLALLEDRASRINVCYHLNLPCSHAVSSSLRSACRFELPEGASATCIAVELRPIDYCPSCCLVTLLGYYGLHYNT